MQKKDLRTRFLALAMARTADEVERGTLALEARIRALPIFQSASLLALYHAMPSEPATRKLIDAAVKMGKRVALPRFGDDEPQLGQFSGWDQLVPGPLGISQPVGAIVPVEQVEAFFVPGLAFDRAGYRLGRGKGYYDRLLARRSPLAFLCGLGFDDMLVEELPHEAHDIPMNCVLTPGGVANPRDLVGYPLD